MLSPLSTLLAIGLLIQLYSLGLAKDLVADPEDYPYILRILGNSTDGSNLGIQKSCTGVLLSRSVILTSANCIKQSSDSSYWIHSYKLDEFDGSSIFVEKFTGKSKVVMINDDESNTISSKSHALIILDYAIPVCEIETEREYAVAEFEFHSKTLNHLKNKTRFDDCASLWYSERIEDQVLHMRNCTIQENITGRQKRSISLCDELSNERDASDYENFNDKIVICRSGKETYKVIGTLSHFRDNFAEKQRRFEHEKIVGNDVRGRGITITPQLENFSSELLKTLKRIGKLEEVTSDSDKCDAFYAFNRGHLDN